jgi:hypothetical protein
MFTFLPDDIINIIYSFYNPYKKDYLLVLSEMKNKIQYSKCMNEIDRYCLYDKHRNVISFQREWIIG